MNKVKLEDVFPEYDNGKGVFTSMDEDLQTPVSKQDMDIELFTKYGEKLASKLVLKYVDENNQITDDGRKRIMNYLQNKLKLRWQHYKGIDDSTYNPIHNYSKTEVETTNRTGYDKTTNDLTDTLSHGQKQTTKQGTEYHSENHTEEKGYGWNGGTEQPISTTDATTDTKPVSGEDTIQMSGDDTTVRTGSIQYDKNTTDTRTNNTDGNIGVMTTQDMLNQELNFWGNYNIVDAMIKDIIKEITIPIY